MSGHAVTATSRLVAMLLAVVSLIGCAGGVPSHRDRASAEVSWIGGVVELRGDWRMVVDPAPDPSDLPAPEAESWTIQEVPAPFDLGLSRRAGGLVTWWHREVRLGVPAVSVAGRPALGVTLGKVNSAYELWVGPTDGAKRLGSIGSAPEAGHPEGSSDYDRHAVWPVPPQLVDDEPSLDLWLRVWTDPQHAAGGGPHEGPFRFGDLKQLVRDETISELPQLFLAGLFVLLGLFHLELFRRRRDERGYLWLGVVACLFGAYSFLRTQWKYAFAASVPGLSFGRLKETEHIVAFVMVAAFVQLIWTLLGFERGGLVRAAQALFLALAVAVVVVPGMAINHSLLVIWQAVSILLVFRGLYLILLEAWQENPDAHLVSVGAILGTVAFVNDVLVDREWISTPRLTAYGFAVFVVFLAATLAEQFARKLREIEELRRSEEAAERANCAKSQFLANVSHEIRTPMTAILGGTELLLRRDLPADARRRTEVIQRSATDLLQVIDDILDVSKIEAGRLELRPDDFHPSELVDDVIDLFTPQVRRRGISLRGQISPMVPAKVRADPIRLRQVLLNLVSNAVKFTDDGEVVVLVDYLMISSIRGELTLAVTDTGVGIDPRDLTTLFEPFSQADGSTSRRVGGTGLGLTISRRLAELMGGHLEVTSRPGRGSTFTLTLPVEDSDAASAELPVASLAPSPEQPHRILLAEDNEVNRLIVREQLELLGYQVLTATDGNEVLDLLEREAVDLVLMDCQMPEVDGYEASRRLRAREAAAGARRLPILALTAHAFQGERDRCLQAGMDDYLSKPFHSDELQRLLDAWLARSV